MVTSTGPSLAQRQAVHGASQPSRVRRFQADSVVDCVSESLFAAKVPFRGLDAHVAEQELDLFKLPAGFVTQT
jgi:hypothetical protein